MILRNQKALPMKMHKYNIALLFLLIVSNITLAQTRKLDKSYNVNNDVVIKINSKHTNLLVESWDKNVVSVEAYLNSEKLNKEETKKLLNEWNLSATGNTGEVVINSSGGMSVGPDINMEGITGSIGELQNLIGPMVTDLIGPILSDMPIPKLPSEFYSKMGKLNFDYQAYQKDGEKYMKKWEKQVENNFGDDFQKSMEEWGKQFEKNAEVWEAQIEKNSEGLEKKFEADMEKWGENFGKRMEIWGNNFERKMEGKEDVKLYVNEMFSNNSSKAIRTIKLRVPKNAVLKLDVRHGDVILDRKTTNLKATLSHSNFKATTIDGEKTEVKASYTPINVGSWNYGILNTSYVNDCRINNVRSIKLISSSSDVVIGEISQTGILSGNFGKLRIDKLSSGFKNLDISVDNSELELSLPATATSFNYNGTQSEISYPKVNTVKSTKSYDNLSLNGFYKNQSSSSIISIKARFSEVVVK